MSSSDSDPYSTFPPSSNPILVSYSSDDENEDGNPPIPTHLPLDKSN